MVDIQLNIISYIYLTQTYTHSHTHPHTHTHTHLHTHTHSSIYTNVGSTFDCIHCSFYEHVRVTLR